MARQTVINRRVWAWSSIEWEIIRTNPDGSAAAREIILPILALDYDDECTITNVQAAGDGIYGVADGQYNPKGMSITLLAKYYRELGRQATNGGEVPLSSVDFRIVAKMRARGESTVITDEIDFRMMAPKDSRKTGNEPLQTVVACLPQLILRDGVRI